MSRSMEVWRADAYEDLQVSGMKERGSGAHGER